jgi:hypothetical protein
MVAVAVLAIVAAAVLKMLSFLDSATAAAEIVMEVIVSLKIKINYYSIASIFFIFSL